MSGFRGDTMITLDIRGALPYSEGQQLRDKIREIYLMLNPNPDGKLVVCSTKTDYDEYLNQITNNVWEAYRIKIPTILFKWMDLAFYSAWFDVPTIIVNYEKYKKGKKEYVISELTRNITHMIIHRSPSMYIIPTPDDWIDLERRVLLNQATVDTAFYILADGIREFEATRFLVNNHLAEKTIPSIYYKLKLLEKESSIWGEHLESQSLLFTILLNTFRILASVSPLLTIWENVSDKLVDVTDSIIQKLPIYMRNDFKWLIEDFLPRLGNNTIKNINITASIVLSTIVPSFLRMKNSMI